MPPGDVVLPSGETISAAEAAARQAAGTLDSADGAADTVIVDGETLTAEEAAIRQAAGTLGDVETAQAGAEAILQDVREREYGGTLRELQTAAQGAARALTFGASDLALEALGQEELMQTLREVNPSAALAGEVGGAVLSIFAGGAGAAKAAGQAPGVAARIVSLTPRGQLAARGARWAAGATSTAGRAGRRIAVEAVEGGADLASAALVRQLIADQEIDGSEIGAKAVRGVLLGAAGGAVGEALGAGLGLAGAALRRGDLPGVPSGPARAYDDARAAVERRITEGADNVTVSDLAGKRYNSLQAHRQLGTEIRTAARRNGIKEADDVLAQPTLRASLDAETRTAVGATLRRQAQQVAEAGAAAEAWRRRYQRALGTMRTEAEYAARAARIDPALTRDGSKILAKLDDVTTEFDATLNTLRRADAEGAQVLQAAPANGAPYVSVGQRIRDRVGALTSRIPGVGRVGDVATQLAAGAEAAQLAGVQVPSVSQLLGGGAVGKTVGLLIGARALGQGSITDAVGTLVPGMRRVVQIASAANQYRGQIRQAVARGFLGAQRGTRVVAPKAIKTNAKYDPRQFQAAREVVARSMAEMPGTVGAEALASIDRIEQYLASSEPKQPNPGSPFFADWSPDPVSQDAWDRRTSTAADAGWAVRRIFATPQASIEIEALRACHPAVYAEIQTQLQAVATDIHRIEKMAVPMRKSLSLGFGVALMPQYLPGYLNPTATAAPEPLPQYARPSTASTNPLVSGESVRGPRKQAS